MEDIDKALRVNPGIIIEEARARLSSPVKEFAHSFADDSDANDLPPLYSSLDHAIRSVSITAFHGNITAAIESTLIYRARRYTSVHRW